jgi:hypothetical protein
MLRTYKAAVLSILAIHLSGAEGFLHPSPVHSNAIQLRQSAFSTFRHGLKRCSNGRKGISIKKPSALGAAMMLSAESIFQIENIVIIPFWLSMIVAPNSKVIFPSLRDNHLQPSRSFPIDVALQFTKQIMSSYAVFIPLSVLYLWLLVAGLTSPGNKIALLVCEAHSDLCLPKQAASIFSPALLRSPRFPRPSPTRIAWPRAGRTT